MSGVGICHIFSSMRSMKYQLQQLMNEIMILEKDQKRIYGKVIQRAIAGGQRAAVVSDIRSEEEKRLKSLNSQELNTTYAYRDADKQRVANEKELKRIWAEEVKAEGSRSFFDETLIKVHWVGGYTGKGESSNPFKTAIQFIKSQPGGRIRDEISCFGYTPSQGIDHKPTAVGVIIKGYTTFAYAIDAATHMTSRATDVERRRHSGSGLHKRPMMSNPEQFAQDLVVDEESWGSVTRTYHEVIVDNWVVDGLIIPSFQDMIDAFKRKISGIGRERQGEVDKMVDEAKRDFQELGRLAAETGITFYDDKLKPFDFSGKEFEPGELESEWEKVISPVGDKVQGIATGDPDVPEIVVEGKEIYLDTKGFSKSMTLKNCEIRSLAFENVKGATVRIEECEGTLVGASFQSGEGSLELINPKGKVSDVVKIWPYFTIKSARFVGCNFDYEFMENLRDQREKNGSIITFENCTGLGYGAEEWAEPPDTSAKFYYYGPGTSEVKNLSADKIAMLMMKNSGGNHVVHVDGEWKPAMSIKDVSDSYRKLLPPVPQQRLPPPPPPPPPPQPTMEGIIHRLVRDELLNEDVRRRGGKWCAYVDDKLTKAEKEANPKRHKGKAVGSVQRTPDGKIRMKARACYASKKKANNAMAAAMMEGAESGSLDQLLEEIAEVEALLEGRKPPPGTLWKNIRNRRKAGKRRLKPGDKGDPKTLNFD